jgi:uncharacterized protein YciI
MEFDQYTVALLVAHPDAPEFGEKEVAALQDAHMNHLADLHEAGHLLAVGPLRHERFRGLSVLRVDPKRARQLKEADPAVRAGLYTVELMEWNVPAGLVSFSPGRVPRSVAEAVGEAVIPSPPT